MARNAPKPDTDLVRRRLDMTDAPRIYVASLADYNAGRLHGKWIDLDGKDADDVEAEIAAMIAKSTEQDAEEYAIHDYEGFHGIAIGEYSSLDTIIELAQMLVSVGDLAPALAAFLDNEGGLDALDNVTTAEFEDAYCGEWVDGPDYAAELAEDIGAVDADASWPFSHIDWDAAWRDLECDGYWTADVAGRPAVHVFRPY